MIATVDEVKISLPPDMVTEADEILLQDLIDAVTEQAEQWTNLYIRYGEYTEVLDGNSEVSVIFLKGLKIWELKTVKFNGVPQALELFKIHEKLGGVYSEIGFPDGIANIEITYEAGYDTKEGEDDNETRHEPPAGLKRAIIDEVVIRYEYLRSQNRTGEQIVDLKKNFLCSESERYFSKIRRMVC